MLLMCGNLSLSLNAVQRMCKVSHILRIISMLCVTMFNLVMRNDTDGDEEKRLLEAWHVNDRIQLTLYSS